MNKLAIAGCVAASLTMSGCAQNAEQRGAVRGGAIGAAAGALASLMIPGLGIVGGALLGGTGGAGIGALTAKKTHYQHDERGRYHLDRNGNRVYDDQGTAAPPPEQGSAVPPPEPAPPEQVPAGG